MALRFLIEPACVAASQERDSMAGTPSIPHRLARHDRERVMAEKRLLKAQRKMERCRGQESPDDPTLGMVEHKAKA